MAFFRALHRNASAVNKGKYVLIYHRPSIVVPLNPAAPDLPEKRDLLPCLHSFCQRLHTEHSCHRHNRGDDLPASVIEVAEKAHVNLDHIKMIVVKGIQRGILVSEIIHPDLIAGLLELTDCQRQGPMIPDHDPFGDFKAEHGSWNLVSCHNVLNDIQQVIRIKIICREVHGNRNQWQAIVTSVPDQPGYLLQNITVQAVDELRIFEDRNEDTRKNHPMDRVLPACQRFKSAEFPCQCPDHRLEIHLDIVFFKRFTEMAQDICLICKGFSHHGSVNCDAPIPVRLDRIAGNFSHIKSMPQGVQRILFRGLIDTHLQLNSIVMDIAVHLSADMLQLCLQIRGRQKRDEMIRRQMADQCSGEVSRDGFGNFLQAQISPMHAIHPVIFFETGHVKTHRTEGTHIRQSNPLLCLPERRLIEIMHAHHARFVVTAKIA